MPAVGVQEATVPPAQATSDKDPDAFGEYDGKAATTVGNHSMSLRATLPSYGVATTKRTIPPRWSEEAGLNSVKPAVRDRDT